MRKTNFVKLLLLGALALPSVAHASFEDVEVSPKSRAMGASFVAITPDVYAPFHNPASLAWVTEVEGAASYLRPFGYDFSSQSVISGVAQINPKYGGIGIAFRRFGADYRGESLTGETTISLAHGFKLNSDANTELAVGYSLNLYSLDFGKSVTGIDPGSASAVGLNVAATAKVADRTTFGLYAQNLNNASIGSIDEEELHRRVGIGVGYSPYRGVNTVFDISEELGEDFQFRGGTEFQVTDFLWLRSGLRTSPNIYSAGVGISHRGIRVDYGFSTGGGTLDATHQFGIGYALAR